MSDSIRLTKGNALPGTYLIVQDQIGLFNKNENRPYVTIMTLDQDQAWYAPPGCVLRIIQSPRKITWEGVRINFCQVQKINYGLPGEIGYVYWTELKTSTKVIVDDVPNS